MRQAIEIRSAEPMSTDALALLAAGHKAMQSQFSAKRAIDFSVDALTADHAEVFLAYREHVPVGCCAVSNETHYSELKKLFVASQARGLGIAAMLIQHTERTARSAGSAKMMLESGAGLHPAHRLYRRLGYTQRAAFGPHKDLPDSLFFEKPLTS